MFERFRHHNTASALLEYPRRIRMRTAVKLSVVNNLILKVLFTLILIRLTISPQQGQQLRKELTIHEKSTCQLCHVPSFCAFPNKHSLILPSSTKPILYKAALTKSCDFRVSKSHIRLRESPIIFLPDTDLAPPQRLDVINPTSARKPENEKRRRMLTHIPHYVEMVFLQVVRTLTVFEDLLTMLSSDDAQLNPALIVNDRESRNSAWFKGLHITLTKSFPPLRTIDVTTPGMNCFRSAIYASCRTPIQNVTFIFQRRIAKLVRNVGPGMNTFQVGLLSRRKTRNIVDSESVAKRVLSTLNTLDYEAHCRQLFFEKRSFSSQMKEMSRLNVLIAAHGAGNANIIFMKPGSVLLEILPFGLSSDFRRLGQAVGLKYASIYAAPDHSSVLTCAKTKLKDDSTFLPAWHECAMGNDSRLCSIDNTMARRSCLRSQSLQLVNNELEDTLASQIGSETRLVR